MIETGTKIKSLVKCDWPSQVDVGSEGRVLLKQGRAFLVNIEGEQRTMFEEEFEVIE